MGFGLPDDLKGGKDKKKLLQSKPLNIKWKGKKNGNRNNNFALRHNPASFPSASYVINGHQHTISKARPVGFKNRMKRRRLAARRKLRNSPHAPHAPRNTTSFIMRSKSLGGIAPPITPSPVTPAVIPTPARSPGLRYKGSLEDMNKDLGVNGYGSMNGLIRLRAYNDRVRVISESESDVEQGDQAFEDLSIRSVEQLEQRIGQGLSRFEIIYPCGSDGAAASKNLEDCADNQEVLIARLEVENSILKECLFLVEQEVTELRRKVRELEGRFGSDAPKEEHPQESCEDASVPPN